MTDLRTHWMRTVHEALCGLSAKRLMLGERIIGGECATADVTCHGCRAVLRLAAMDAASGGPDDLRTLAHAVVSAYETYDGERTASVGRDYIVIDDCRARYYAACKALEAPLDMLSGSIAAVASARAILAALNAERAQGYARAMGEVVERCEATVADNAKSRRWDPYTMGMCDEMDRVADWARARLAVGRRARR